MLIINRTKHGSVQANQDEHTNEHQLAWSVDVTCTTTNSS